MTTVRTLLPLKTSTLSLGRGGNPIITFQDEVNQLFHDFFGESTPSRWASKPEASGAIVPALDVLETEKGYRISAELPGLDSKDVSIKLADGYVTISGEKKQETKEEKDGYFRQERSYGSFQRVVALPDTANLDKAEASFKNGVLTVSVPKKTSSQSKERTLEIKSAA